MDLEIKERNGFKYIDEGEGEVLLLLHGLFGALSNWEHVTEHFSKKYRVVIPMLPLYTLPLKDAGLKGLNKFVEKFVKEFGFEKVNIVGNSLGGHVGLIYTLKNQEKVNRLILTGSSGLYENTMGTSFPKRGDYQFVKEKTEYTFYDPKVATKELIDEVYETTKDNGKCIRIVYLARSAQKNNLRDDLKDIKVKTCLIWGSNDTITPPEVAHEFNEKIPDTELHFIDKCCHAPMMEHPKTFNTLLEDFLERTKN
ncbi:alpha/beta fold hydrolase [Sediminitomix flava]|uniref:Pimeloyl-ACP methyl ester carboxylesterase n=1 Tax=Sediminitomix flava TaxID=379075 RepID=A0A315ZFI4_SEDFL|nr:alpha/beta hydrolase [Sediminitomix flava]PWJ44082.1 pimeloyl-ACP methyl ester carboxylesterase [Sediminitomix flava]